MNGFWVIFRRETRESLEQRSFQVSVFGLAVVFPVVLAFVLHSALSSAVPSSLATAYLVECGILATIAGIAKAAETFAGEREHHTLEALLVAPVGDLSVVLAKGLAVWVPTIALGLLAEGIFSLAAHLLGVRFSLAATDALLALAGVPLLGTASLALCIWISSAVDEARKAHQLSSLVLIPWIVLVYLGARYLNNLSLVTSLLILAVILAVAVLVTALAVPLWRRQAIFARRG